jgi:hypothetical protein
MRASRTARSQPSAVAPALAPPSQRTALWRRLFTPVDNASLAVFRIAFGGILVWEVLRFFQQGWIEEVYSAPGFHFTYHGFEWVRPWPGSGMTWHFVALGLLAACVAVGFCYRAAIALFCLGFTYVFLLDKAHYLNHFYLICLLSFLLIFVPANRWLALDARLWPSLRSDFAPAWSLWILRGMVAIPYVYGGIAKLSGDWLAGQPMQMRMAEMAHIRQIVPWFGEDWLALAFSYGGLVLDLFVVPLLLWRPTRYYAFALAVVFHLLNAWMFRIGIFPWLMIAATTLFLPPDWPRRLFRLTQARLPAETLAPQARPGELSMTHVWAAVLAVFFAVQLVVPFRHWLYPGNVDWTEEGSRFAWRMMLNEKQTALRILLIDPATGGATAPDLTKLLTAKQRERLASDPENLREFAQLLKDMLRSEGLPRAEVRVYCLSSLNGRKPQLLVDPDLDLGIQPRTLAHKPWIRPLTETLPREPWRVPPSEWEQHVAKP